MRTIFAALSCFLVAGIVTLPTATRAQTTIFMDDFSGAGGPLNGTTPDVTTAGEVWETGDTFLDDGTANTTVAGGADGQAAHLNFTPSAGAVYTAEATVLNTNTNWVGFGFLPDVPPGDLADWTVQDFAVRHSNAPGYAWALTRNNASANNQEGFTVGASAATAQPWNGNVVDATQPVDFKIVLDTSGSSWTTEWFFNGASQGAPVAFDVEGNPGIGGIGFSHERNATANSGATLQSFSLVEEVAPTLLTLFVNTSTGQTSIRNTSAESVDFNYYIAESAGNALSTTGWNSLHDQGLGAPPAADFDGSGTVDAGDLSQWQGDYSANGDSDADGDGDSDGQDYLIWQRQFGQSTAEGSTWEEAGGVSPAQLAELLLDGATTLAPNDELDLGNAFNPSVFGLGVDGDLTFQFGSPDGPLHIGGVVYVSGALSAATAVPEPSTLALVLAVLGGCSLVRRG